jgi:5-formyltetrahydrofolate cyclo-ligase
VTDPGELGPWRKELRAELLSRRMAVRRNVRLAWNDAITALLLEGFPDLRTMVVGFYWPFRGEFDPRPAIQRLMEDGARAALPVVVQKNAPLQFQAWWPGAPMRESGGLFKIPVPDATDIVTPEALLIPPVGFDSCGYRLGYGGGYFDRTLASMAPQPLKIGVGFELSRIPTIRPQPYDIPMDFIVTEAGIGKYQPASAASYRQRGPLRDKFLVDMKDPTAVRTAIKGARTNGEVVGIVRDFLSSLSLEESASVPRGLIPTGINSAEAVMQAALEIAHKEVLSAFDSPESNLLKDIGSVLTAASAKLATLSLGLEDSAAA